MSGQHQRRAALRALLAPELHAARQLRGRGWAETGGVSGCGALCAVGDALFMPLLPSLACPCLTARAEQNQNSHLCKASRTSHTCLPQTDEGQPRGSRRLCSQADSLWLAGTLPNCKQSKMAGLSKCTQVPSSPRFLLMHLTT